MKVPSKYLWSLALCGALSACKTSGDLKASGSDDVDPTGVKTVSRPDDVTNDAAPKTVAAKDAPKEAPPSVDALQRQNAVLQGELEEARVLSKQNEEKLQARVTELEKQNQELNDELQKAKTQINIPPALAKGEGKGAKSLWDLALQDLKAGRFEPALGNFQEIVRSYSKDSRHMGAIVGAAFTQYKLRQFKDSAVSFNLVIDKYSKRPESSLAWFGGGAALAQAGQLEDSKLFFQEVVTRYPKSVEAAEARKILARKKKVPADLFTLFPAWAKAAGPEAR